MWLLVIALYVHSFRSSLVLLRWQCTSPFIHGFGPITSVTIYENLIVLCIGTADYMVFDLCIIGLLDRPGNRSHLEHIGTGIMHNVGQHTSVLEVDTEQKLIVYVFT